MPGPVQDSSTPPSRPDGTRRLSGHRSAEQDSSGRDLALRLPDWDLVPPTEFLDRHPGR